MKIDQSLIQDMNLDMTPMIDIVFLLITFFMFVFNFSQAEQDERIHLPTSELAKISELGQTNIMTVQLTAGGTIIIGTEEFSFDRLNTYLLRELKLFEILGTDKSKVLVFVRGDAAAQTGKIQEILSECRKIGLEQFRLPALQSPPGTL